MEQVKFVENNNTNTKKSNTLVFKTSMESNQRGGHLPDLLLCYCPEQKANT